MSNLRIPEYVKEFKCIGAECEDDCCHGWSVFIDKDSYDSYKEDKNIEMKEKYDKYLENENSTFSFDYGIMKMKENGKMSNARRFLDYVQFIRIMEKNYHILAGFIQEASRNF